MEIIKNTMLETKVSFSKEDFEIAIRNHIMKEFPDLTIEDDDFNGMFDFVAEFNYDPVKHGED